MTTFAGLKKRIISHVLDAYQSESWQIIERMHISKLCCFICLCSDRGETVCILDRVICVLEENSWPEKFSKKVHLTFSFIVLKWLL